MQCPRIVVVDDDVAITKFIRANLEEGGFEVFSATTGTQALHVIEERLPSLIILDIMLPDFNGFEVLQHLREWSQIPVIALSARRDIRDKTRCLNLGADDYMTKPFAIEELLARVRAVLRRCQAVDSVTTTPSFISGDLQIHFVKRKVTIAGNEIRLTPIEYNLMKELTLNAGRPLTYDYLLHKIWGSEYGSEREYLHVYIGYLRAKIEADPKHPSRIINIPGVGYSFRNEE